MSTSTHFTPEREIFTVSRLVREVRAVLEGSFPLLWIEGEISSLSRPASGHLYFTLKDEAAQVRCAMFRMRAIHLGFRPEKGQRVVARVRVGLYEARGEFQLIVEHMEEAGFGELQRRFEALKRRLAEEGLFDQRHKRPLPPFPHRIGVVTSPTGAALRDVLNVLGRRAPATSVLIYPAQVQGEGAPEEITRAISLACRRAECDLLIVARGGGGAEDLWAFNDERVARAIFDCRLPVITGIGHEIDFTIADFVADLRAPTPSAAAELAVPDQLELMQRVDRLGQRLQRRMEAVIDDARRHLGHLEGRLRQLHPGRALERRREHLLHLENRIQQQMAHHLLEKRRRLERAESALARHHPGQRLAALAERNRQLGQRLEKAMGQIVAARRARLSGLGRALHGVSPLATLERGYAILQHGENGRLITDARQVEPNERITARLARGCLICRVEEREEGPSGPDR